MSIQLRSVPVPAELPGRRTLALPLLIVGCVITLHVDYNNDEPVRRRQMSGQKVASAGWNIVRINLFRQLFTQLMRRFSIV